MDITSYGKRYLIDTDFLELCKKLEIIDMDKYRLEFFERRKLLFPKRRIILDTEYIRYMHAIKHDPDNPFYGKNQFEFPDKWVHQYKIETIIKNWHGLGSYHEVFHLLDKKKNKFKKFIRVPSCSRFRKWNTYDISVKTKQYGEYKTSKAIHLYDYWQAYHAYDILKALRMKLLVDTTDKVTVQKIWHRRIPMKKVLLMSLPRVYNQKPGDFLGWNSDFDALSFYVHSIDRLNKISLYVWQDDFRLKGDNYAFIAKRYESNVKRITTLTKNKYELNENRLFDFMKYLCCKYFEYEEEKMVTLAEMLKRDIRNLTYLLSGGYGLTVEDIIKKVGKITFHFKDTLKVIFPNEIDEAKEKTAFILKTYLNTNPPFYENYNIDKSDIERFLNYLETKGLVHFYHAIDQLSDDWFSYKSFSQSQRQSHVIYLSLLMEVPLKTIARSGKRQELADIFANRHQLIGTLKEFFKCEPWWSILKSNWRLTEITDKTNIEDLLQNKIMNYTFYSLNEKWDNIVRMFLVCGITRNLSAHEHQKLLPLTVDVYQLMVSQIVLALWFCWMHAEKRNLI